MKSADPRAGENLLRQICADTPVCALLSGGGLARRSLRPRSATEPRRSVLFSAWVGCRESPHGVWLLGSFSTRIGREKGVRNHLNFHPTCPKIDQQIKRLS